MKKQNNSLKKNLEVNGIDIEDLRLSLVEASVSGLFTFIEENMMEKKVDIIHDFKNLNFKNDNQILPVRITFEPMSDEERDHWIAVLETKIH